MVSNYKRGTVIIINWPWYYKITREINEGKKEYTKIRSETGQPLIV